MQHAQSCTVHVVLYRVHGTQRNFAAAAWAKKAVRMKLDQLPPPPQPPPPQP